MASSSKELRQNYSHPNNLGFSPHYYRTSCFRYV